MLAALAQAKDSLNPEPITVASKPRADSRFPRPTSSSRRIAQLMENAESVVLGETLATSRVVVKLAGAVSALKKHGGCTVVLDSLEDMETR